MNFKKAISPPLLFYLKELPSALRSATDRGEFKRLPKTHLFALSNPVQLVAYLDTRTRPPLDQSCEIAINKFHTYIDVAQKLDVIQKKTTWKISERCWTKTVEYFSTQVAGTANGCLSKLREKGESEPSSIIRMNRFMAPRTFTLESIFNDDRLILFRLFK